MVLYTGFLCEFYENLLGFVLEVYIIILFKLALAVQRLMNNVSSKNDK